MIRRMRQRVPAGASSESTRDGGPRAADVEAQRGQYPKRAKSSAYSMRSRSSRPGVSRTSLLAMPSLPAVEHPRHLRERQQSEAPARVQVADHGLEPVLQPVDVRAGQVELRLRAQVVVEDEGVVAVLPERLVVPGLDLGRSGRDAVGVAVGELGAEAGEWLADGHEDRRRSGRGGRPARASGGACAAASTGAAVFIEPTPALGVAVARWSSRCLANSRSRAEPPAFGTCTNRMARPSCRNTGIRASWAGWVGDTCWNVLGP